MELLLQTRLQNPKSTIVYKPHPDVDAGLRAGEVPIADSRKYADHVWTDLNAAAAIDAVDEVWTMTSLLGFEALLRGKKVTCLGMPFYAGWGLTRDLGIGQLRRAARPDVVALAHATLIGYPRYFDDRSGDVLTVEQALDILLDPAHDGPRVNKLVAWLSGIMPAAFQARRRNG